MEKTIDDKIKEAPKGIMIGYGDPDLILATMALDEFKQQFNPKQFYRYLRRMRFDKEDAKRATRHYANGVYGSILEIYAYRNR
jgi:hypothetical protein